MSFGCFLKPINMRYVLSDPFSKCPVATATKITPSAFREDGVYTAKKNRLFSSDCLQRAHDLGGESVLPNL